MFIRDYSEKQSVDILRNLCIVVQSSEIERKYQKDLVVVVVAAIIVEIFFPFLIYIYIYIKERNN